MTLAALAFAPLSRLQGATLSKRHEDDGYLDRWGAPDARGQLCVLQLAAEPVDGNTSMLYALTEAHSENLILSASWQRVALGHLPSKQADKIITRFNRLANGLEISPPHYRALPAYSVHWPDPTQQSPLEMAQQVAKFEHVKTESRLQLFMNAMNDQMNKRLRDKLFERRERLLSRYGHSSEKGDSIYWSYTNRMVEINAARP
jgi:hypothetical protein